MIQQIPYLVRETQFMQRLITFIGLLLLFCALDLSAQLTKDEILQQDLVQFSGMVVSSESNNQDDLQPIFYCHIQNKSLNRGTVSNIDGLFSFVVRPNDTILFSSLGFKANYYIIPDTLENRESLSVIHIMEVDTIQLAEAIIYPFPTPSEFRRKFLELEIEDDPIAMYEKAFGRSIEVDYTPQKTNAPELGATMVISGPISALADFVRDGKYRKMDRYRKKLGIYDSIQLEQKDLRPDKIELIPDFLKKKKDEEEDERQ